MGSEGLFHYSDIPRQYTQAVLCKQGAVFEPTGALTWMPKAETSPSRKIGWARNPSIISSDMPQTQGRHQSRFN